MTTGSEPASAGTGAESAIEKLKAAVSGKDGPAKDGPAKNSVGKNSSGNAIESGRVGSESARRSEDEAPRRIMLPAIAAKTRPGKGFDLRTLGLAGATLAVGTLLGAGASMLSRGGDSGRGALAEMQAATEANRVEANRLNGEIEKLARTLATLRETSDGMRGEVRARETALSDRLGKVDQGLAAKIAALGERVEQANRAHDARIAGLVTQIEKRPAPAPVAAAPAPKAEPARAETAKAEPMRAEPTQTGAIPDTKKAAEKPPVVEGWAVRDVYDGTAVLEDKRRRLFDAVIGEAVPGVGRVEAIERRGREWVVVTRQGIITAQPW